MKKRFVSLRSRMLLLFSVAVIASNAFLLFFSVSRYSRELEQKSLQSADGVLGNLIGNLEAYLSEVANITDLVTYNYHIQDYLLLRRAGPGSTGTERSAQDVQMGVTLLGNIISTRSDIASLFLFDGDGIALYKTSPFNIDTGFAWQDEPSYREAAAHPGTVAVTGPYRPAYATHAAQPVLSISRSIESYDGSGTLGIVRVDANLSAIQRYCRSARPANGYLFVVSDAGDTVYHPGTQDPADEAWAASFHATYGDVLTRMGLSPEGAFRADIGGTDYQVVYRSMEKTAWKVVAATPYRVITEEAARIRGLIILVGLMCLVLVTLAAVILSNRITKPLTALRRSMDKADHGNFAVRVPVRSHDEVGELSESFNHMLQRIGDLMDQVVADQEEKRKLELTALQHQINPHFLYNTLDSIIWLAEMKDDSVVPMTEALSKLFRISLSKGREVIALHDELEHVRNYLFIQSMRYLNKFTYRIDAPESLLDCLTVKLILQPLVENSIYHGIKNKPGKGFIGIEAREVDGQLILTVADDGIGMTVHAGFPAKAADEGMSATAGDSVPSGTADQGTPGGPAVAPSDALPVRAIRPAGSGFGVRNVDERIKLYFGKEYGLRFESAPGEGTRAIVTLPCRRTSDHAADASV